MKLKDRHYKPYPPKNGQNRILSLLPPFLWSLYGIRDDTGYGHGENDHAKHIFVGESLGSAMTFMYCGQTKVGMEIARRLYEAIAVLHRTPWNQYCFISAKDGHPIWGQDYYSDMAFWAIPMARKRLKIASFVAEGELIDQILEAGK